MDYDDHVFKEEVDNDTVDVVNLSDVPSQFVVEESILIIFALIGISANVLLIYIICHFRKLHTNTNIYLVNWAIADVGSTLITLSFFRVFSFVLDIPEQILCFYVGLAFALIFNEMVFMIMLTVDWCLSSYLPRPLEKFRHYTRIIVAVLWVLSALYTLTSSLMCTSLSKYYLIFHITLPLTFAALLLFVLILHSIRLVKKYQKRPEYHPVSMLVLPSVFVLCWILGWADLLFLHLPTDYYMVTETPGFLHPIINLLLLIILNNDFKTCFFQVIKCPTWRPFKSTPQNNEENLNNGDEPVSFDNKMFDHPNRHI